MTTKNIHFYTYKLKSPIDCSLGEIDEFYKLVLEAGKVLEIGLRERIKNSALMGFCYFQNELIAISAIKVPLDTYKNKIIKKTRISRVAEELNFEIGYSFTKKKYRRKGINKKIKENLIKEISTKSGIIFSTTAIESSRNFLVQNGFVKSGTSYNGQNDKNIQYFEKIL